MGTLCTSIIAGWPPFWWTQRIPGCFWDNAVHIGVCGVVGVEQETLVQTRRTVHTKTVIKGAVDGIHFQLPEKENNMSRNQQWLLYFIKWYWWGYWRWYCHATTKAAILRKADMFMWAIHKLANLSHNKCAKIAHIQTISSTFRTPPRTN